MKIWFITLPLMYVVGISTAVGAETDGTASPGAAPPARQQTAKPKHPPRGDLRHCLDLKTNEAIIRCAEKKPKK
jgi:hypothetical protein